MLLLNDEMSQIYLRRSSIRHIRMLFRNYDIALKNKQRPRREENALTIFGNVICPFTYVYSKILGGEALLYIV